MAKISIIVPVYNVALFLPQCLSSLINQTLKDIEIILIDDGSTDLSGKICDDYAAKDSRIIVVHSEHRGLSAARNKGIALSIAPFIMFVDSDDWVEPDFCELPYSIEMSNQSDIILFKRNTVFNDGKVVEFKNKMTGELSEEQALYFNTFYGTNVWLAFYDRHLFMNIQFPEGKFFEDIATTHKLIHNAKSIFLINKALYNYRELRPGSITANSMKSADLEEMFLLKIHDLEKWGYDGLAQYTALRMLMMRGCQNDDMSPFLNIIKNMKSVPICFGFNQRVIFYLFKISPFLFDFVCMIMGKKR